MDEFIAKYNGKQTTDPWGGYLGECVSLWKRYAQEVQGIPPEDLYVPDGAAKNIWFKFTDNMAKHYVKVSSPQRGDAAIYDGSYGDVAIVVSPTQVFGQLGTPVFRPAATRSIGNPIGFIRKKGDDMSDIADHDFVADACVLGMNLQPETNQVFLNNIGLPKSQVLKNILGYSESKNLRLRAQSYDGLQKEIADLKAQGAPTILKSNTLYKTP